MRKPITLFFILLQIVLLFGIITEEQAREYFSKALFAWYEGDVRRAKELMETATSGLIYVTDIPEFWYFMAKIDIDMRAIQKAQEDLKTILVISPGKDEVISLLKEMEVLQQPLVFTRPVVYEKLTGVASYSEGIEYFYTPTAATLYGDTIIVADQANQRLVYYSYENYRVMKTSVEPISVEIFPNGDLFVSSRRKLVKISATDNMERVIYEDFSNCLLAGFDRLGRLWGSDVNRLFYVEGEELVFVNLQEFYAIQDIEICLKGIWILDVLQDRLVLMDFTGRKIEERSAFGSWCFEVSISGDPVILTKNGEFVLVEKDGQRILHKFGGGVINIDYRYPFLVVFDWHKHMVEVYPMKGEEPIFVKIDSLSFSEETIKLNFRVENVFGDTIPYLSNLLQIREGGGPVYFDFKIDHAKIEWLKPEERFFDSILPYIRRGKTYGVLFERFPKQFSRSDLVTLKGKNVRIFVSEEPNEYVLLSGGAGYLGSQKNMLQNFYSASFKRTRPVPSDITPVTVSIKIGDQIYSDTIYYTRGMIQ